MDKNQCKVDYVYFWGESDIPVTVLAIDKRKVWAMVRRRGAMPFCVMIKELR